MKNEKLQERLDQLSEELIFTDDSNLEVLDSVYGNFRDIYDEVKDSLPEKYHLDVDEMEKSKVRNVLIESIQTLQRFSRDDTHTMENVESGKDEAISFHEKEDDDIELFYDFINESKEHLEASEKSLLTLETNPGDKDSINTIFRAFHSLKGLAGFLMLDDVQSLAHEAENILVLIRSGELKIVSELIDIFFIVLDMFNQMSKQIEKSLADKSSLARVPGFEIMLKNLQEIAKNKGMNETLQDKQSDILTENFNDTGSVNNKVKEVVKIDAERLDRLIDTIGEVVIAESMLKQFVDQHENNSNQLSSRIVYMSKITRELQSMATSLRMIPIKGLFQKMNRLVRDLGRKADKKVDLIINGEDTELDKSVIDMLADPLVHLLRNAVDHGIEDDVSKRTGLGKSETGSISLKAFHQGGNIVVEVADDGKGLDHELIYEKALQKGLVRQNETLTKSEIFNLIFSPGFSTAKKVTDVSGRGVGMDVVKRNIEQLRGNIRIDSERGRGTKMIIILPLTLAIIDGMITKTGSEQYIIPTLSVIRTIRPQKDEIKTVFQKDEVFYFEGEHVPLVRMRNLFGLKQDDENTESELIVVLESVGHKIGLVVDELLGQGQIVIKNLSNFTKKIDGVAGGTILPDGTVGLILDVCEIVKKIINTKKEQTEGGE
ncbi:MAG: chemotaxis protein CheA [Bacteriovoracaceae bacterium]|nr:chemotaxis protein CheA [Bacteriovoracaceae bacterium]